MTDDQLTAAAINAELASPEEWEGETRVTAMWQEDVDLLPALRRFAQIVEAEAYERCAGICEGMAYAKETAAIVSPESMAIACESAIRAAAPTPRPGAQKEKTP